jgi:hypothetical protein
MAKQMEWLLVAALGCFLTACASSKSGKVDPKNIDWNSRIGSYTYEQAVAELGRPSVQGESAEGKRAEWILKRSPRMSFGFGMGTGSYGRHTGVGVGVGTGVSPPPHGEYLRLQFDPEGKLKGWEKVRY